MKEIEARFLAIQLAHPMWGDVIVLSGAIQKMKYPKATIQKAFNKLVSKDQYEQDEKNEIINSLVNYSNGSK